MSIITLWSPLYVYSLQMVPFPISLPRTSKRELILYGVFFLVSIGSTVGLFLGASLLSFLELLFYLFIRMHHFDLNKVNKIRDERQKESTSKWRQVTVSPKSSSSFYFGHRPVHSRKNKLSRGLKIL